MKKEIIIYIIQCIIGLFSIALIALVFYFIWNPSWPTLQIILTIAFSTFLLSNALDKDDDDNDGSGGSSTTNRESFQDKVKRKMEAHGS